MLISFDAPLAPLTTLGLGGNAHRLVEVYDETELVEVVQDADRKREPLLVVGGGSNLLIADEGFAGTVLRPLLRGIRALGDGRLTVPAGEDFDALVAQAVGSGWAGLECMSGIPGLAGATPMQNVGAYGQEIGEVIESVRVLDRQSSTVASLPRSECAFRYRDSKFRNNPRYVILEVVLRLTEQRHSLPIRYAELARALGVREGESAPLGAVRETVLALRRQKGMVLDARDPDSVSAGSFFTNPVLSQEALAALDSRCPQKPPRFPHDGGFKVPAGWLVEQAGFQKGYGAGRVGVSTKHALALVHRGGGTSGELLALARTIRDGVLQRFGVRLEPEPILVGLTL